MSTEGELCLKVKNRAQAAQLAYELKDKTVDMVAEIKRKTKARSKDANAYAWELRLLRLTQRRIRPESRRNA